MTAKRSSSTSQTERPLTLLEIGHVGRPHGLKGELVVRLVTNVVERLAPGSVLGSPSSPLVVEHARPLGSKGGPYVSQWVVKFAGVDDPQSARALTGSMLRAEARDGAEGLWVHELVGAEVVTTDGQSRGEVVSVEANPASDLLVLASGSLVPLRFVLSFDAGRLVVDPPPGLFDL